MGTEVARPVGWQLFDARTDKSLRLIDRHAAEMALSSGHFSYGSLAMPDPDLLLHHAWSIAVEALLEALMTEAELRISARLALPTSTWPLWLRTMPITMEHAGVVYGGAPMDEACAQVISNHLASMRRDLTGRGLLGILASLWERGEEEFWRTICAALETEASGEWGSAAIVERLVRLHERHLEIMMRGDRALDGTQRTLSTNEASDAVDWVIAVGHVVRDVHGGA